MSTLIARASQGMTSPTNLPLALPVGPGEQGGLDKLALLDGPHAQRGPGEQVGPTTLPRRPDASQQAALCDQAEWYRGAGPTSFLSRPTTNALQKHKQASSYQCQISVSHHY